MLGLLFRLPLIVALMAIGALAMYVPAVFAAVGREWVPARAFFYSGTICIVLTVMIGLATANRSGNRPPRAPLLDLLAAFSVLPLMLAVPVWESQSGVPFSDAYFEMVSSLTTTGASVLEGTEVLFIFDAVHLWRALVGWLGGFLMWVMAIAILAPMSLGGFEVMGRMPMAYSANASQIANTADRTARLRYYTTLLAPIYLGLTLVLWIGLFLLGEAPFVALCHAMSTMATSGISPVQGTVQGQAGFGGELLIAVFLVFALSRQTFTRDGMVTGAERFRRDHELRVGVTLATVIPLLLFLRHWVGAIGDTANAPFIQGLQALWGGFFTVLSFLTTTGFESTSWNVAEEWSGIGTPELIFIGLALVGGGVATTAGGIKLLRVHVLYRYSQREVDRLIHPSSIGRLGRGTHGEKRQGAVLAWIFFMLFLLSIAAVMAALSLTGLEFEQAMLFSVAALSTTGPLVPFVTDVPNAYAMLTGPGKTILAAAMVLGRLETLAIIALFNPEFWRR